jgi:ubiquinone/menaquinone biosynthesis C-methylase UbiE
MINKEILEHYEAGIEFERLSKELYLIERIRTQEIITRYLRKTPIKILDVGGGTGFYSFWLGGLNNEVHLLDPVSGHIKEAKSYSEKSKKFLASIEVGEARQLKHKDNYFDLILLFGPLYHITERSERLRALSEAKRVLKPGGVCLCVGISRYASTLDGYFRNFVDDPRFVEIMNQDLKNGQHRNPTDNLQYFTTAFVHEPEEFKMEIIESGFRFEKLIAIDSFGWLIPALGNKLNNLRYRETLLQSIRMIEEKTSLMGISAHIMGVAKKE